MKIDLKRAVEVLEACGYECDELTSRDAEIAGLNQHFAEVSKCHGIDLRERDAAIKSWTEKNRQLREQVTLLRDAIEYSGVAKTCQELADALAATKGIQK